MTMTMLEAIIILICLVLVSNIISHYLTFLPVSLLQIALGLLLALAFKVQIPLRTDWFMLLFIAPLLFNDGRHFPKAELWALRGPIIANAIFLVLATTIVGGYVIHWLVPDLPLAASFALAAIISPTDPVAVQSISSQAKLPDGVLHLVSGESLINDASGLIGFKYGIAATVTGLFSWQHATTDFFYIALVGAVVGVALMYLIRGLQAFLLQQGISDVVLHTVLQLVTPFIIYLVAEEGAHASGVIAVVAAGIVYNFSNQNYAGYLPELKIVTERTWDIAIYLLNGVVFIILGIELPVAMTQTIRNPNDSTPVAILDVILVWLAIFALRVIWTLGNMLFHYLNPSKDDVRPSIGVALLSGLSGVRGAITMAGVLSVPYYVASGAPFPERSIMLFIAAGVIILSLLMAVIFIPLITKSKVSIMTRGSDLGGDDELQSQENMAQGMVEKPSEKELPEVKARIYTMQLAVRRIESERHTSNQRAVYDLISEYQEMIRQLQVANRTEEQLVPFLEDELKLRQVGLNGEAQVLDQLWQEGKIQGRTYSYFQKNLARRRQMLINLPKQLNGSHILVQIGHLRHNLNRLRYQVIAHRQKGPFYNERLYVEKECAKGGIKALSTFLKTTAAKKHRYNRQLIYQIIVNYRNQIEQIKQMNHAQGHSPRVTYDRQMRELRLKALAAERTGIQNMLEERYISWQLAAKLRQYVNYSENALLLADNVEDN